MEVINMDPLVKSFLMSMQAPYSPPVLPQLALEIMVNPPSPGDHSHEVYSQVGRIYIEKPWNKKQRNPQKGINKHYSKMCVENLISIMTAIWKTWIFFILVIPTIDCVNLKCLDKCPLWKKKEKFLQIFLFSCIIDGGVNPSAFALPQNQQLKIKT